MKGTSIIGPLSLLLLPVCAHAQPADGDISRTLFGHVLNAHSLELFPLLPAIPLPPGLSVHAFMLLLSATVVFALFALVFRRPMLKPGRPAVALESVVLFIRDDVVYPIMGEQRGEKWLPFFTTLFVFLLAVNFLGLIPAFKTATGNINVTSALAFLVFALIFLVGIGRIGWGPFFRNLFPSGTPWPIALFVAFLEFVGIFVKSSVLSVRIFANMFAGHLAILSFIMLIFVLSPFFAFVSLPFALFTYALEVIVALIQALVFTLLSCIFITHASTVEGEA